MNPEGWRQTGTGVRFRTRSDNVLVLEGADIPWLQAAEDAKAGAYASGTTFRAKGGTVVLNPEEPRMSDFTRGEFEARLEATEERMNARLAGIEANLGVLINKVDVLSAQALENKAEVVRVRDEVSRAREATLASRGVVVTVVIGTGLTIVGLAYAILAYGLQSVQTAISVMRAMPSP